MLQLRVLIGFPQNGMYVASKHAVLGLTKTAALKYGSQGFRINAVNPAVLETEILDHFVGGHNGWPEEDSQCRTLDVFKRCRVHVWAGCHD